MMAALQGKEHRCDYDGIGAYPVREGKYCYVPVTHRVSLGEIVSLLHKFDDQQKTLVMPEIPSGSFAKKLYSTYLSYLPASKVAFPLKRANRAYALKYISTAYLKMQLFFAFVDAY